MQMQDKKSGDSIREASIEDIQDICTRLRAEDIAEVKATSGATPLESILESLRHPKVGPYVAVIDGSPELIFGVVAPLPNGIGHPWMLATDQLKENPKAFIRHTKEVVKKMSDAFPVLVNYVHAENDLHIRWLKWCGFKFAREPVTYGVVGEKFWQFVMIKGE